MNIQPFNNIIKRQVIAQYIALYGSDRKDKEWNLKAVIDTFRYFYDQYYEHFAEIHPRLSNESVRRVIEKLGHTDGYFDVDMAFNGTLCPLEDGIDLFPEMYPQMIDEYFKQPFVDCDYKITHFMSDNIRILRYYELFY